MLATVALLLTAGLLLPWAVDTVNGHAELIASEVAPPRTPTAPPHWPPHPVDASTITVPEDVAEVPADATFTASGLAWRVLRVGSGTEHPASTSRLVLDATIWTQDRTLHASSLTEDRPYELTPSGMIEGLREGVALMVVGEHRRFWIPGPLAYDRLPASPRQPRGMVVVDVALYAID